MIGTQTVTKALVKRPEPALPDDRPVAELSGPGEESAIVATTEPVTLVGSRRDCDLYLDHGDVSKPHCAIVNTGTELIAVDLCSRTGTFVNDERVTAARLNPGDQVRLGTAPIEINFLNEGGGKRARAKRTAQAAPLESPLWLRLGEEVFKLTELPAVIGRRHTCQVVVDTPDVSLAHALLFTISGKPVVFDLGSRSGTYVNGERGSLAWLCDGDQVCIGGEDLTLSWRGSQYTEEGEQVVAVDTAPVRQQQVAMPPGGMPAAGDLDELGAMVEGLRQQIASSQTVMQQRSQELDQREAELKAFAASLHDTRKEFEEQRRQLDEQQAQFSEQRLEHEKIQAALEMERAALEEQRQEIDAERADLDRRQKAVGQREAKVQEREQVIERRTGELDSRFSGLEQDRKRVDDQLAAIRRDQTELTSQKQGLKERVAKFRELAARLKKQERSLDKRESLVAEAEAELGSKRAQLQQSESETLAAAQKIEQFKQALAEARSAFADSGLPVDAPPTAVSVEPSPSAGKSNGVAKNGTTQVATREAASTVLPAPLVDRPLFGGLDPANTAEWPVELRERLETLRRLTGRSEEEIVSQVLAEYEAQRTAGEEQQPEPKKKKRRFW